MPCILFCQACTLSLCIRVWICSRAQHDCRCPPDECPPVVTKADYARRKSRGQEQAVPNTVDSKGALDIRCVTSEQQLAGGSCAIALPVCTLPLQCAP